MFHFVDYNMCILATHLYVIVQMNMKMNDDTCHNYEEQKLSKLFKDLVH